MKKAWRELLVYIQLAGSFGFSMVCAMGTGAGLGYLLDKFVVRHGSAGFVMGILLGAVVGMWSFVKRLMANIDDHDVNNV